MPQSLWTTPDWTNKETNPVWPAVIRVYSLPSLFRKQLLMTYSGTVQIIIYYIIYFLNNNYTTYKQQLYLSKDKHVQNSEALEMTYKTGQRIIILVPLLKHSHLHWCFTQVLTVYLLKYCTYVKVWSVCLP